MTKQTRKGYISVLELLVLVGIVSLLIGILIPALGKARESARELKAKTEQRQRQQLLQETGSVCVKGEIVWTQFDKDIEGVLVFYELEDGTIVKTTSGDRPKVGETGVVEITIHDLQKSRINRLAMRMSPADYFSDEVQQAIADIRAEVDSNDYQLLADLYESRASSEVRNASFVKTED